MRAGFRADECQGALFRPGSTIRPVRGHRVIHIGEGEHARAEGDGLAPQPLGVAGAVPLLMVAVGDLRRFGQIGNAYQPVVGVYAMAFNQDPFLVRQLAGLQQHGIGHTELADIVQQRPAAQMRHGGVVESQGRSHPDRHGDDALGVPLGLLVAQIQGLDPPLESGLVGLAQLSQGRFQPGVLVAQFAVAAQARDRAHARPEFGAVEGLGDEVVGPGLDPLEPGAPVLQRGDHEHRNLGQVLGGAQPPADLEAVHARHHHVEQDHVRLHGCGPFQRLRPVAGLVQFVAFGLQRIDQRLPRRGVVVHDQYSALLFAHDVLSFFPSAPASSVSMVSISSFMPTGLVR